MLVKPFPPPAHRSYRGVAEESVPETAAEVHIHTVCEVIEILRPVPLVSELADDIRLLESVAVALDIVRDRYSGIVDMLLVDVQTWN